MSTIKGSNFSALSLSQDRMNLFFIPYLFFCKVQMANPHPPTLVVLESKQRHIAWVTNNSGVRAKDVDVMHGQGDRHIHSDCPDFGGSIKANRPCNNDDNRCTEGR